MIKETTWVTIRGVHGAQEAPRFGEQLTDGGRFHLSEVLTSMNGSEVGEVSVIVQLICDNGVTSRLHQIQVRP
jgi:hypothetical protein